MKLTARLFPILVLAFLIVPISLFQGCGDNKSVPDGTTITISPSTVSLENVGEQVVNFKVTVRYADGSPMPYANLVITGGFASPAPTSSYQFYWYPEGNLVSANPTVDSGFKPQTDKYGVYNFSIVVFGTTAFSDTINATSGTAVGQADIALTTT